MRVVMCAMAKNEHHYINEWVEYYLNLGVDKIYIYDNDNQSSPFLKDYISIEYLPKVRIINARGLHWDKMQHDLYTRFYQVEKDNFDWCIYCDIDEFLIGVKDIKEFLKQPQFRNKQQIRIKWKLYGDDNIVKRNTYKVFGQFTKEITRSLSNDLSREVRLQNQGKSIVKGGLTNIVFHSPHYAQYLTMNRVLPSVYPSGKKTESGVELVEDYSKESVFFNHYMTKTLSEFIEQKMNRTDAVFGKRQINLNYFWRINEKTSDKIKYLQDMGLE